MRNRKRRSRRAVTTAASMPTRYIDIITNAACDAKKVPVSSTKMGRRAEHDMKGLMRMVMIRLERLSMAREAIMAGTLHPKPI